MRMKIRTYLILFVVAAGTLITACDRQLELQPKDSQSTSQALSTIKGINAAVVGMYANLRSVSYYGRYQFIYGDLSANDVYLAKANSNRFIPTFQRSFAAVDADALGI